MNTNVALRQENIQSLKIVFDFLPPSPLEALDVCHGIYHTHHCFYLETGPYFRRLPLSAFREAAYFQRANGWNKVRHIELGLLSIQETHL